LEERIDTRLPPGSVIDSSDWYDVLSAVFEPLDARSDRGLWGFAADEHAALTRGHQAVFNLRWLRDYMEGDTFLEYAEEPVLRAHADRLVEDAQLVGADQLIPVLAEIAPIVADSHQPPLDDDLLDEVHRLEQAFFALEDKHGALWDLLADYVRRTPEEFVRPGHSTP
jgi:hypothetical protein